jgi:hypothetical protein
MHIFCINHFIQSYGNDGELLGYRRHYLALASSWVAVCKRELNEEIKDAFSTSLQQWGILLRKIPTIFDAGNIVLFFYHHSKITKLKMLHRTHHKSRPTTCT